MGGVDWAELALVSREEQWTAAHPYPFIVSTVRMVRPPRAAPTAANQAALRPRDAGRESKADLSREPPTGVFRLVDFSRAPPKVRATRPLVLPVRKVQPTFPSMITIGRTENNDLAIPDEQVSKFHAFFRVLGTRVELADAGSRNGTFVGGSRLESRGASVQLPPRQLFSFGAIEFQLFDARGCWEWLRQLERF